MTEFDRYAPDTAYNNRIIQRVIRDTDRGAAPRNPAGHKKRDHRRFCRSRRLRTPAWIVAPRSASDRYRLPAL